MTPIINADELVQLSLDINDILIIDASNSSNAKDLYISEHLEGAIFVDAQTQLSDIKGDAAKGGRHPLPSLSKFENTLSELGISKDTHIVVYDRSYGANAAARLWWMLLAVGQEKVQVLNGGFQAAVLAGYPTESGQSKQRQPTSYEIDTWKFPTASLSEVKIASANHEAIIVDVREKDRYNGIVEPIDLVAGNIPGAVNIPYAGSLDERGIFKDPELLKKHFGTILKMTPDSKVIVHCGSGVTACHTILSFACAGLELPTLYVGSWSEWSRNNLPMVKRGDIAN